MEIVRREETQVGLLPQLTFTPQWQGKPCACAISLLELTRLTGHFSAGPKAAP